MKNNLKDFFEDCFEENVGSFDFKKLDVDELFEISAGSGGCSGGGTGGGGYFSGIYIPLH